MTACTWVCRCSTLTAALLLHQAGAIHEEKLRSMMSRGDSRLLVDVGDLRAYDSKLCGQVLNSPAEYLPAFDKAVAEAVAHLNPEYGKVRIFPHAFCNAVRVRR